MKKYVLVGLILGILMSLVSFNDVEARTIKPSHVHKRINKNKYAKIMKRSYKYNRPCAAYANCKGIRKLYPF